MEFREQASARARFELTKLIRYLYTDLRTVKLLIHLFRSDMKTTVILLRKCIHAKIRIMFHIRIAETDKRVCSPKPFKGFFFKRRVRFKNYLRKMTHTFVNLSDTFEGNIESFEGLEYDIFAFTNWTSTLKKQF